MTVASTAGDAAYWALAIFLVLLGVGSLIALGTVLLVLAAFIINLRLIGRTVRAGGSITAHPVNLILAVAAFASIAIVVGVMIVDQYPCWVGVPNCD